MAPKILLETSNLVSLSEIVYTLASRYND